MAKKKNFQETLGLLLNDENETPYKSETKQTQTPTEKEVEEVIEKEQTDSTKRRVGRPSLEEDTTRTSFILDKTQLYKIRYIANKEGLSQKDILKEALGRVIASYEQKHGEIEIYPSENSKDIKDIF